MLFLSPIYLTLASALVGGPLSLPILPALDTAPKATQTPVLKMDSANAKKYVDIVSQIDQAIKDDKALKDRMTAVVIKYLLDVDSFAQIELRTITALNEIPEVKSILKANGWTVEQFAQLTCVMMQNVIGIVMEQAESMMRAMKNSLGGSEDELANMEITLDVDGGFKDFRTTPEEKAVLKPYIEKLSTFEFFNLLKTHDNSEPQD